MNLVLHPVTKKIVDDFRKNPSHGLLLSAQSGSGKGTIAKYIISEIFNIELDKVSNHPNIKIVEPEKNAITIEQIREVNNFLKLKTSGKTDFKRAVIFENIELMGIEAQNAFLKNLEEPPKDTIIILTCSNPKAILSTITSRVQQINILPVLKTDVLKYFGDKYSTNKIERAYHLSEGSIGLLSAVLNEDSEHPLVQQIDIAKDIYRKNVFERLNLVDEIAKKGSLNDFLLALELVCHAALLNAVNKNDKSIKSWTERSKTILQTQQFYLNNPNTKLLLTNLFIHL